MKNSILPKPPTWADMIIGDSFSGWVWWSVSWKGGLTWWFLYRRHGDTGAHALHFRNVQNLEQFIDELELDEIKL